jgi:hypothetical protein
MESPPTLPQARTEGLVVEELADEILVYDLDVKHAHCLTPLAARVWRECDGRTRPAVIAERLGYEPAEVVHAVAELERCQLLVSVKPLKSGLSRRDFGLKVTKVAAAASALPVILSIAAPAVAATFSQEAKCNSFAPNGTNFCSVCNQPTGNNTLCCCCHGPAVDFAGNPAPGGNKKLCAADARQCCCQDRAGDFGPAHHCTESNTEDDTGAGPGSQLCTNVVC